MEFEQILIRLGVDAKAVNVGLTRVSSFAKGWATSFTTDMKHHFKSMFSSGAIFGMLEAGFERLKEKGIFISRIAKETGLTTNMIQGMGRELELEGESFEAISKPLGKFNALIGQAKLGIPEARLKLIEWGIATKTENWNNLTLTRGVINLAKEFDRLGDKQKQAALLQAVYGKQFQALVPIYEQGAAAVAAMDKGNFLTKLTPASVEMYADSAKAGWGIGKFWSNLGAIANGIPVLMRSVKSLYGSTAGGEYKTDSWSMVWSKMIHMWPGIKTAELEHNELLKDKKGLLEENLHLYQLQNEQAKLQNVIADQHKFTVGELASRARELMGDRTPRGLASIYALTPAMATSLRIQKLEDRAKELEAYGRSGEADRLQSQASEIRSQSGFLTTKEQNPLFETEKRLQEIRDILGVTGAKVQGIHGNH